MNHFLHFRKILNGSYKIERQRILEQITFFRRYNCLFIHIPKTGGISASEALFKKDSFGHFFISEYYKIAPRTEFDNMFKFSIVRNPYTRIYSAYMYLKNEGRNTGLDRAYSKIINQYQSFDEFVATWLSKRKNQDQMLHFVPQYKFVSYKDKLLVDFIGRSESLSEDVKIIANRLNIDSYVLERKNSSSNGGIEVEMKSETRIIIQDIYQKDFEMFNYLT